MENPSRLDKQEESNDDKRENLANNVGSGSIDGDLSGYGGDGDDAGHCAVMKRLINLLQQQPNDLEITILDPCHCNATNNNDDENDAKTPSSSSSPATSITTLSDKKKQKNAKKKQMKKMMNTGCKNMEHLLVLQEGHLGIDAIAFPWMTRLIRAEYKCHKEKMKRTMQQKKENEFQDNKQYWIDMYWITSCLLLVNPDHTTVWADKRRALQQLVTSSSSIPALQETSSIIIKDEESLSSSSSLRSSRWWFQQEYQFINLLMTQHSKAPSSWAHRKYIVQQMLLHFPNNDAAGVSGSSSPTTTTSLPLATDVHDCGNENNKNLEIWISLIQKELSICTKIAEKYPKNYYAWTHRRWMIQQIVSNAPATEKEEGGAASSPPSLLSNFYSSYLRRLIYEEFTYIVQTWLPRHVSDHSAVHYGQQMLFVWLELFGGEDSMVSLKSNSTEVDVSDSVATATTTPVSLTTTSATSSLSDDDVTLYQLALSSSQELTNQFPDHEALWIFRRQVVTTILCWYFQTVQITDKDISDLVWNQIWESHIHQVYMEVIVTKSTDSNTVNADLSEASADITTGGCCLQPSSLIHSWTYLLWVLHHVRRLQQHRQQGPILKTTDVAATDELIQTMYTTTRDILHNYSKSCCLLSSSSVTVGRNGNGIIVHRLWEDKKS